MYNLPDFFIPWSRYVPLIEILTGTFFILKPNQKAFSYIIVMMLILFSLILIVGIIGGELESCGCFGGYFIMSPAASIVRNIVLLLLVIYVMMEQS
jgi:hypothetical protein